jgi:hypothetical protein
MVRKNPMKDMKGAVETGSLDLFKKAAVQVEKIDAEIIDTIIVNKYFDILEYVIDAGKYPLETHQVVLYNFIPPKLKAKIATKNL